MIQKSAIQKDISPEEAKCLLEQGAEALGLSLSLYQVDQFMSYLTLLDKWNRRINLTGLRSCREIILKHFLDSLTPIPYFSEKRRLLDLGSGAGFPGLPIKIVRPTQPVTLIEASAKKVSFLKEAVRHLELGHIPIYQSYLGKGPPPLLETDPFEIIITRAVGKIINLLIAADSLLRPEGKVLFMKGPKGPEEIFGLKAQIQERGFRLETPIVLTLPFLEQERTLIFVTKSKIKNNSILTFGF
jgi:16S rRNA (guanine527-N7)-methyltransferase